MKEFSINSTVKVKLTGQGLEMMKKHYKNIPQADKQGYMHFAFWQLMTTFGPEITAGDMPFESGITIDDEMLVDVPDKSNGMHR